MQRASGSCRPREATQRNGHGEERPSMAGRWREQARHELQRAGRSRGG